MATVTPDEGLDWYRDKVLDAGDASSEAVYDVAVGDGSTSVNSSDTQLDNELFRGNNDGTTVDIVATSNLGEYTVSISISGGTEVPAGTDITEFGVWARDPSINDNNVTESDDHMVYRERRPAVTLESGDTKTFRFSVTITE